MILNVAKFPGGYASPASPVESSEQKSYALTVSRNLQKQILSIYGDFLSEDGNGVDYEGMAKSDAFAAYVASTAELQHVELGDLDENERKAFCLNLYNALCVHGNIVVGPPDASVKGSLGKFFGEVSYSIGGQNYSLDDIEHGILRNNAIHPSSGKQFFGEGDVRAKYVIPLDCRIHCALVCGAKSCPPIRLFSATNLERGLELAATNFVSSDTTVDIESRTVNTSKIFMWYGKDFGADDKALLSWMVKYLKEPTKTALQKMLADGDEIKITFADYNWSTNKQ
mmetsp:Transcript_15408/g.30300  ORF Transcript_15408/g.30300 Transcript_15408/m.30300 type:complete len:283 (+) Transcript_15408:85-933(+)